MYQVSQQDSLLGRVSTGSTNSKKKKENLDYKKNLEVYSAVYKLRLVSSSRALEEVGLSQCRTEKQIEILKNEKTSPSHYTNS